VWTGIGAAGTFLVGIGFFGDTTSIGKYVGVTLIISGVVVLKLSHWSAPRLLSQIRAAAPPVA
jgi:quaternary ammonium compound-resistance protein SugE